MAARVAAHSSGEVSLQFCNLLFLFGIGGACVAVAGSVVEVLHRSLVFGLPLESNSTALSGGGHAK